MTRVPPVLNRRAHVNPPRPALEAGGAFLDADGEVCDAVLDLSAPTVRQGLGLLRQLLHQRPDRRLGARQLVDSEWVRAGLAQQPAAATAGAR